MELTFNNDGVFFNIACKDFADERNAIRLTNENVVEFSVNEELGKITEGSLTLLDKQNLYSKLFRYGMRFEVAWGYRKWNSNLIASASRFNAASSRQGLQAVVMNPQGSGNHGGEIIYRINFYSTEILKQKRVRVFDTGNKRDVVEELFDDIGVADPIVKIDSQEQNFRLSTENVIRQNESSFALLKLLASKWHCTLHVGCTRTGRRVGIFIDTKQGDNKTVDQFLELNGATEAEKTLYYDNGDLSNVISYEWQNHIGDSGQGFFIKMDYVNGTYIFQRYKAETQSVVSYKLNQARLAEYVKEHQTQESALISEIVNAQSFNSQIGDKTVIWFFDRISEETAPDGLGFTVNCAMKGDPFVMPTLRIAFGDNFSDELRIDKTRAFRVPIYFTVRKAAHRISKAGYFTDAEIVDGYILNQGFLRDTKPLQIVQ